MKLLLESTAFDALNKSLSFDTVDRNIIGRLESYSCKMIGEEKAQYKRFNSDVVPRVNDMEVLSPPQTLSEFADDLCFHRQARIGCNNVSESVPATSQSASSSSSIPSSVDSSKMLSSFGHKVSRKTLFYLISTLNASFYPDYDFSNTAPQEFSMEPSLEWVIRSIERRLTISKKSDLSDLNSSLAKLWAKIDDVICLQESEIYSYNPDPPSDPYFEDGCLWSFYYFFYNVRLKRIVFFTCRAVSSLTDSSQCSWTPYFDD
ncbi:Repressor of RNA polymerase III transcription MAF1-like protein [Armadillidium nasatum]|uniref:Repressor of RNA polymerase III transcription MAF1 n=1 Tax=Armadillidium nasatum TaxID=96803 RepID=A0A5N5TH14_9CRUS|nr:Repressor of RNA polymerase III transcription MAF1-like protein [Armadillidium nasatum]